MRADEINLEQFHSFEEFYEFIDANALKLEKRRDLANMWVRYRDAARNEDEKEKAQFEIDYLLHYLLDGKLFPLIHGKTGKAEKTCSYPDLCEGGKKEFGHLLFRAENSKTPLLKAKFYHILWQCPSGLRNRRFAEAAAIHYVESIELLLDEITVRGNETLLSLMQQDFENLAAICKEAKLNDVAIDKILKQILEDQKNIPFYVKEQLATVVLKYPTLFSQDSIVFCYNAYEDHFWKDESRADPFLIIHHYAPNAIKFARKLKKDQKRWFRLIGELQLDHVKKENHKNRDWLNLSELLGARNNLKKGGDQSLLKEAEELYEEIRPTVKLGSRPLTITREQHQELFHYRDSREELAKKLVKESNSDSIYGRLILGIDFPKASAFKEGTKDLVPDFFKGVQTVFFDINGNAITGSDDLDGKVMLMNFYQMELDFQTIPFLYELFTKGIESGKLTAKNLIEHLATKTWIGNPYFIQDQQNRDRIKSWISLLAPGIHELFSQIRVSLASSTYQPSYVLAIDSLVLKIEGLLRFFLYQSGLKTTVAKTKKIEAMTLNQILESEGFKKYFDEDDQLFFDYLFGGEGSLDIRNNVAHCFYDDENYHIMTGILIICALLRISKYNFKWEGNGNISR
ncbi:DUF4209 domain-containing protein [Algoriphagus sp. H41]|uniref:DUF4209 domain-containing protein n=1 Tax=Algoriphagus oliviformis TaxID=2811231 RepID=A0ABS3BXF5_9BACT|nr:DUF4209 domain-containing protein [Algoriphagus oliviformis]MBN7809539.1 DUF4209 domain-containing protein [Algoriphagus oliviformis]